MRYAACAVILLCMPAMSRAEETWPPAIDPLLRTVDLTVGESCQVKLSDGKTASVKLVDLHETRDDLRQAVRKARVTVEVNGQRASLISGNYRLPVALGGVQLDCAVTRGCVQSEKNSAPDTATRLRLNPWALEKDARLRLWPAGSPWIQPGTFGYPVKQRWFADSTQMANEPVFVDHGEIPGKKSIYYHYGLDFGGAEGLVEVVAATDAVVIAAGKETADLAKYPPIIQPGYDEVYLRDGRGWYYRYCHLLSIDKAMKPGAHVKMGQKVGVLGKEGGSGGWSHLHFDIMGPQPSGEYGVIEGYAFVWQTYHAQRKTQLQAVARPHHVAWVGEPVVLDGSRSWSINGVNRIANYQWLLCDGTTLDGQKVSRTYKKPGQYSEMLKVTDDGGNTDYDVAVVQIFDRQHPTELPPSIHAAYWPTFGINAGNEVTFKVRSFGIGPAEGHERWDFGDGTLPVEVQSDGNAKPLAKDGYAVTKHRFGKAGHFLVSVSRTNDRGQTATARLHVRIE